MSGFRVTHREAHLEWDIKRFWNLAVRSDIRDFSPEFILSNSRWYLGISIFNKSCSCCPIRRVVIEMCLLKYNSLEQFCVSYCMGIKRNDGSELGTINYKHNFGMITGMGKFHTILDRPILHRFEDIISSDGSLTVFCTARIENTKDVQSQTTSPYVIPAVAEDFSRLYHDRQNTDITIKVKDKELVAHKNILCARSKVFSAMFNHDMTEKNTGTVKVDDNDPESFEDFILHMYTGRLDVVSPSNALSLYKIADKYDVKELKEECVRCMTRELSPDSICDVMLVAVMHGENELLESALTLLAENMTYIVNTPKWQKFSDDNQVFVHELILKAHHKLLHK